jgi:hypothetical protein
MVTMTCSTALPVPAAGAVSASCVRPERVGTADSANVLGPAAAAAVEKDLSRRMAGSAPATKRVPVSIPVYWHAIGKDTTVQGGSIPDSAVQE